MAIAATARLCKIYMCASGEERAFGLIVGKIIREDIDIWLWSVLKEVKEVDWSLQALTMNDLSVFYGS